MLNFNSVLVFSEDPEKLEKFYTDVFGKDPGWKDSGYFGFQVGSYYFTVGPHDKVHGKSPNPERIMLNFETEDVKVEFDRIKKAGAEVIKEPYQMEGMGENDWIATFADPDGNYFQLMSPMKMD